jgi:hypothetical protein
MQYLVVLDVSKEAVRCPVNATVTPTGLALFAMLVLLDGQDRLAIDVCQLCLPTKHVLKTFRLTFFLFF